MKKVLFLLLVFAAAISQAQVTDTSRFPRDSWPYWKAGLTNGYNPPTNNYTTTLYFTNAVGYVGDGVTDNSTAWTNIYALASDLSTIVFPPGKTVITNYMFPKKRVRLVGTGTRGGPYVSGKSLLILSAGDDSSISTIAPIILGNDSSRNIALCTNGFSRGSTTLFLNNITGMAAGQTVRFYETNDNLTYVLANYAKDLPGGCGNTDQHNWGVFESSESFCTASFAHIGQAFTIVATHSGNQSIDISAPIYWGHFSLANVPTAEALSDTSSGVGIENLVINYTNGNADFVIYNIYANNNWITDCCMSNSTHAFIQLSDCNNCLVRGNQTWFHRVMDSNAREGVAIGNYVSDCLIENNSFEGGNITVKSQLMTSGNVIAYNFGHIGWATNSGNPTIDGSVYCGISGMHGDMPMYDLWEGNVLTQFSGDSFWGGGRSATLLRNWWTRDGYAGVPVASIRYNQGADVGIYIDSTNWYYTAVGNVIGSGRDVGDGNVNHIIMAVGYARSELPTPNVPPASPADFTSGSTLFFHGNYNMVTQTAQWSNSIPQVVSNSYYLASAPSWFGTMQWPPIGPDISGSIVSSLNLSNTMLIPAQGFELYGTNPAAPFVPVTKTY